MNQSREVKEMNQAEGQVNNVEWSIVSNVTDKLKPYRQETILICNYDMQWHWKDSLEVTEW